MIESSLQTILTNGSSAYGLRKSPLEGIALCGTLPPGVTGSTYAMIAQLKPVNCLLFVDACQDIEPCLESGMVDVLKINVEEASVLAGYGYVRVSCTSIVSYDSCDEC